MLELFANPAYLVAGGALLSSPIIIHLINRMRFKRLRWAAMEFLLKAQKKSRRRLIIEQLILLLLRILLVALAALLVLRFLGLGLGDLFGAQKDNLHIVVLDDTVSMNDRWKDADGPRDCLAVAKKDMLQENILKSLSQSTTNDRLVIIPLSRVALDPKYQPKIHERLNDKANYDLAFQEIEEIRPSKLHVPMLKGLQRHQQIALDHTDKRVRVHVISDFRKQDWSGPDARALNEEMLKTVQPKELAKLRPEGLKIKLADEKDFIKIRPWDTAHPARESREGGTPVGHKNVGIVDMRPSTRVTGRGMPVQFTVTVANYSTQENDVQVLIFDDATGDERLDVTFNERMPLKVPAGDTATCSFTIPGFFPELKEKESYFAQLSARLLSGERQPLADDGLEDDNVRHAAVEVRNKVPVLVVDGLGAEGRREGNDSFFIKHALESAPSSSYEVVFADKLEGVADDPRVALESADLGQYPTILLLNVPSLTPKQVTNLENYVRQGGGVGFFLGPQVDAVLYNEQLYKNGKGVFPVPLEEKYFPPKGAAELKADYTGRYQLLLRDDQFPGKDEKIPVFGPIFREAKLRDFMKHLPVRRYWPTLPQAEWKGEPGRVREVANLPNEKPVANTELAAEALGVATSLPLDNDEYKAYHANLKRHQTEIINAARDPRTQAYQLAEMLQQLLTDRGDDKEFANLQEFWKIPAAKITTLAKEAQAVRRRLLYSHPMMVVGQFGQGRVVAVMTTAGKAWNDWAGGITGSVLFPSIAWELQNYLSSQSGEGSLTVGTPVRVAVDRKRWGNRPLTVSYYFIKTEQGKKAVEVPIETGKFKDVAGAAPAVQVKADAKAQVNGQDAKVEVKVNAPDAADDGTDTFTFTRTAEPGLYLIKLRGAGDKETEAPLFTWAYVFNVDTRKEGKLARLPQEEWDSAFLHRAGDAIGPLEGPNAENTQSLINRPTDLSESPWFFLLFLGILVCEQALAVHLSFHLKGSEAELPSQVVHPHGKAA